MWNISKVCDEHCGRNASNRGTGVQVHYRSKVWGHLEMSLFLKEKHITLNIKLIRNTV